MSKSNATENALLLLVFNATTWDLIAEDDTTSPAANLYVALHTGDPGEAGTQATSECAYGSYARVAVARTAGGWTVTGGAVENAALVQFPSCSSGSETATYISVGTGSSGATPILYSGALSASLAISSGIQPQFAAGALDISED